MNSIETGKEKDSHYKSTKDFNILMTQRNSVLSQKQAQSQSYVHQTIETGKKHLNTLDKQTEQSIERCQPFGQQSISKLIQAASEPQSTEGNVNCPQNLHSNSMSSKSYKKFYQNTHKNKRISNQISCSPLQLVNTKIQQQFQNPGAKTPQSEHSSKSIQNQYRFKSHSQTRTQKTKRFNATLRQKINIDRIQKSIHQNTKNMQRIVHTARHTPISKEMQKSSIQKGKTHYKEQLEIVNRIVKKTMQNATIEYKNTDS